MSNVKLVPGAGSTAALGPQEGAEKSVEQRDYATMNANNARVVLLTSIRDFRDMRVFHKEGRSLARAGYAVTLIVPGTQDQPVDGISIQAVPRLKNRLLRMTLTVWRVYRKALRQQADVYHFHDSELIPAGLLLRLRGKTVIYGIDEDLPRDLQSKHYLPRWSRPVLGWIAEQIENAACPRFSALVVATNAIGERFRPLNSRTLVVHNYPRFTEFVSSSRAPSIQRGCSVVYMGSISRERGLGEMLQAMELLPEKLDARLKLAGQFAPPDAQRAMEQSPVRNRIDWLGLLNQAEMQELLATVSVGLALYHPEPNHVRAEPFKLFEYMAAGVPVIASDFPLWREIVKGTGCGLVVDPQNPAAIARAIEHVLTHPEEAEAMGRRGREAAAKHYNWENEERNLCRLYERLFNPTNSEDHAA